MPSKSAQITLAAAACTALVAGCGSASGNPTTADARKAMGYADALQFARCMRAHGLTSFPDPTANGGGIQIGGPGSGVNPQAPAFQSAQHACQKYLPGIGTGSLRMTASERAAALRFAVCMRTHGEPDFPDPIQTRPTPSPGHPVAVIALRGMAFELPPGLDPNSPAFRRAASACGLKPPPPASGGS